MSENSKIEWRDHTFNPFIGCTKISPGCDNCYAEAMMDTRLRRVTWGAGQLRARTSAANWREPARWNAQHEQFFAAHGRRQRVFCASLADVFDNAVPAIWRRDLGALIEATPNLDWLLLTKRIGNAAAMLVDMFPGGTPDHVWLGATVVNQAEADRDVPKLLATPVRVRFLSIEPMLGPVDVLKWLDPYTCADCGFHGSEQDASLDGCEACGESFGSGDRCSACGADDQSAKRSCPKCGSHRSFESDAGLIFDSERKLIDWVIAGGGARPAHPDWFRSLRDQCAEAGVPFLFKQWGEYLPWTQFNSALIDDRPEQTRFRTMEWIGDQWDDVGYPLSADSADGCIDGLQCVGRVGKRAAGRLLDGAEHNEFPEVPR